MIKWFGPSHGAKPDVSGYHWTVTPVGEPCAWCGEKIESTDVGITMPYVDEHGARELPYHDECEARRLIGAVAHVQRKCSCFVEGSKCRDPPELTRREAAKEALRLFRLRHHHEFIFAPTVET